VTRQPACLIALLLAITACPEPSAPNTQDEPKSGSTQPPPKPFTGAGSIDLSGLLQQKPEVVEVVLGQPVETGKQRISCVRFVPERVFFACEQEARFYAFSGFERIEVEYEDGVAAAISLVGVMGEGAFEPQKALALAGLELEGEPHHERPALIGGQTDVVDTWTWNNAQARMRVADKEHMVRISVINGEWARSQVEVFDNSPLTEDQKQRIKPIRGATSEAKEPG
jgi:hypothetical protein